MCIRDRRKWYHCCAKIKNTGERCPASLHSSGDILKHLRREMHFVPDFRHGQSVADKLPDGVYSCFGQLCEWCKEMQAHADRKKAKVKSGPSMKLLKQSDIDTQASKEVSKHPPAKKEPVSYPFILPVPKNRKAIEKQCEEIDWQLEQERKCHLSISSPVSA